MIGHLICWITLRHNDTPAAWDVDICRRCKRTIEVSR